MSVPASRMENIALGAGCFFLAAAGASLVTAFVGAIINNNTVTIAGALGAPSSAVVGLLSIALANHLMFKRTNPQYANNET